MDEFQSIIIVKKVNTKGYIECDNIYNTIQNKRIMTPWGIIEATDESH